MTEPTDLHYLSLARLSGLLETREVSSVELTKALIARIERLDDEYRAFITPTFELALDMARAADAEIAAGRKRGALHGIPVALKDAYDSPEPTLVNVRSCGRVVSRWDAALLWHPRAFLHCLFAELWLPLLLRVCC